MWNEGKRRQFLGHQLVSADDDDSGEKYESTGEQQSSCSSGRRHVRFWRSTGNRSESPKLRQSLLEASEADDMRILSPSLARRRMQLERMASIQSAPLTRRVSRPRPTMYTALHGSFFPMSETFTFPNVPTCAHCNAQLAAKEMQWGTGLCDACFDSSLRDCSVCGVRLPLKQLQWGTGLCKHCYERCDKNCRVCLSSLALNQLHWNTGLCDGCFDSCQKTCSLCKSQLQCGQLRWGTGLCDPCYTSVPKDCRICSNRIDSMQLRWNSGLCNACYDESEKVCTMCAGRIPLGSVHWRTKVCDTCYDACEKTCKMCTHCIDRKELHWATGLCDGCYSKCGKECEMCKQRLDSKKLHWGTGLCDSCYDECEKVCKDCSVSIPFGQRNWGSGLCNSCYASFDIKCRLCRLPVSLGQAYRGLQLCDSCFEKCEKTCSACTAQLQIGQYHWGTGLCDACKDNNMLEADDRKLSVSVRCIIGAQFVFYVAPTSLQPTLYVYAEEAGYENPAAVYAAVLTTASVAAMMAPIFLGMWADRRGPREVFCGLTLLSGLGALIMSFGPPSPLFAIAWALVGLPPAVRGVRATYFAKHVDPDELSRVGQLASSSGLLGGFVGPLISVGANRISLTTNVGFSGLSICCTLAAVVDLVYAIALAMFLTPDGTVKKRRSRLLQGLHGGRDALDIETCERCCREMTESEQRFTMSLCNTCYDRFGGENYNFKRYSRHVLVCFCLILMLLEISMNAAVLATFPPLAVSRFHWGNDEIAAVNFAGAGLSVAISFTMAQLRLPERVQMALAASLYVISVFVYAWPPLSLGRLVLGLMLGIKAQILFMAPFAAIFSRLIGRARITNSLTTWLCLAPAIGAAVGTALAPCCVSVAGSIAFVLAGAPAFLALMCIGLGWSRFYALPFPS